jgi:hypothetical protein
MATTALQWRQLLLLLHQHGPLWLCMHGPGFDRHVGAEGGFVASLIGGELEGAGRVGWSRAQWWPMTDVQDLNEASLAPS